LIVGSAPQLARRHRSWSLFVYYCPEFTHRRARALDRTLTVA